ncbi:MAG: SusC/RagA family TonB-linked outer membrane protein [Paludibacteraceae bacterium]|nr:SusC/RagA family TonB-linked outer membrane protein [Paludibacteraceae bacterium]
MKKVFTLLLLVAATLSVYAQTKPVSGVVVDQNGEAVIGASIVAKGTTHGTVSDIDGKFEMNVPTSVKTLVVTFVGMTKKEVPAGQNIKVVLEENAEVLQEVVVSGYGNISKGSYAGSAQAVKAEEIEKKNPSDITKAMAGEVAGVQVVNSSGQPGSVASIRIRGIGSISASSTPLYVVDGIPLDAGSISSIDPGDIASITVLKDATATSLYGSRGANGVIVITTKRGSSHGDEGKIEIDVKGGANMRLLPMYDVIDSPEEYVTLCWQSLYNEQIKKGKNETTAIKNASANLYGKNGIPTIYNLWNTPGNMLINAYDKFGNVNPSFNTDAKRLAMYENMDSWYNTLFHNGLKLEATAKISGGSDKLNYYTSFGYLKDEGYYTASNFQRFNTRANINYQAKKWLKGGLNIQYSYATMSNPVQDDEAANNGFAFVNQIPSIYPVYVYDPATGQVRVDPKTGGKMYDYGDNGNEKIGEEGGRSYSFGINPAGALEWDKQRTVRHQTVANAFLEFKLYDGLKFTLNVGAQYMNNRVNALTNKYYGDAAGIGRVANAQYNYLAVTSNQLLEYNKTFGDHTIRLMAGHETTYFTYNYQYGYKKNIVEDHVNELSNGVSMDGVEGHSRTSTLESALATATYEYDNRYHITANYRADGSSKFAKGHRWGHFGSVGAAWSFTNESFLEPAKEWLKNGKLRLSWGVLGNQDIGDMLYTDHYTVENVDGNKGYVWSYKGNPNLTWERTSTIDLGLEFSINKYLDVEFDYFYKKTDNMLFPRYVAPSLGYSGYYVNDAAMENQGVEFDLKAHLVDMRNIKLDFRLNGGYYRNKMLLMPIDGYNEDGSEKRMVMSGGMSVGHSTYDYYMVHYEGVNENGEATYTAYYDAKKGGFGTSSADLIGAGETGDNYISSVYEYIQKNKEAGVETDVRTTSVSGEDYIYAGENYVGKSAMPDLDGGFGLDFEAYGVTLSISCSYRIGGYGYDNQYAYLMHSEKVGKQNWHKDIRNAWTPGTVVTDENRMTLVPRLSNGSDQYANAASDRFLTSNSYLSLNNINLGYKFPKKLIEKIKLNSLQVWVAADNLAIATARKGYNPMMSSTGTNGYSDYSPLSTIMGGIKVQF